MMGQTAESAGGVVHGDLDGDVVFKDIDWELYDPDDPPDGTIGNVDPGTPGIPFEPGYVDPDERLRVLAGPAAVRDADGDHGVRRIRRRHVGRPR